MKTIYEQLKICFVMVGEDILTSSGDFTGGDHNFPTPGSGTSTSVSDFDTNG